MTHLPSRRPLSSAILRALISAAALTACDAPTEARRVVIPVRADASPIAASALTDLGYEVRLTRARLALRDLSFTVAGELHTRHAPRWPLVSVAYAHPGHYEGGEVTGVLEGRTLLDLPADDGRLLGEATLLEGRYTAVNFTFEPIDAGGSATLHLEGVAARDGREVRFVVSVAAPEGRALVGVPFEAEVTAATAATSEARLRLELTDPLTAGTLLDGLDFLSLDAAWDGVEDGEARLEAGEARAERDEPYLALRRALLSHTFYRVEWSPRAEPLE